MTQAELEDLCALWQKRLRLQDWRVSVETVRGHTMPDRFACYEARRRFKVAKVTLVEPSDCVPGEMNFEASLVHELLHLHCPAASTEDDESVEFETMLNMVAEALVEAYRGYQDAVT